MRNYLYLEFSDLISALNRNPILRGEDVLGPKERFAGSVNHEYRRIDDGTFLQMQDFTVVEPYEFKLKRKNFVFFQFTKSGRYQRLIGSRIDFVNPATVQISNVPESVSCMSTRGQRLFGVMIGFRREYLIEHYGLRVDAIPVQYRRLFTSANGLPCSLTLPLSAASWNCLEEILSCSLLEPLRSIYLQAKALTLICDVVSTLNTCHPLSAANSATQDRMEKQRIDAAASIYAREIDNPPSVSDVASRVGLHRNRLIVAFRETFRVPPSAYSRQLRMQRARELLAESNLSIGEIASSAGYTSHAAFTRAFHAHFGYSPSAVAKGKIRLELPSDHDAQIAP